MRHSFSGFLGWAAGRLSWKMILRRLKPGSWQQSSTSLNSTRMCPKVPRSSWKRSSVATLGKLNTGFVPYEIFCTILFHADQSFKSFNILVLLFFFSPGPARPSKTASATPGYRMHIWCVFVARLSPLQQPVSRNSCPTSSTGERRWPPSTKSSFGPIRARHRLPPVPPRQLCQCHPPHLSPSENRLLDISWQDFSGEAGNIPRARQDFGPEDG